MYGGLRSAGAAIGAGAGACGGLALMGVALLGLAASPTAAGEVFVGGLAHDDSLVSGTPHEGGTVDVELGYRTPQLEALRYLLRPMVYAKAEVNTAGLTSFYTVGLEWRRHLFHSPFYGAFNLGVSYVDGYALYPNYNAPGLTPAQKQRDLEINITRKAMGSNVVFNPGFTAGYDLTRRISVEAMWDHYSHAHLLGKRNPGMDNLGGRLVYRFGGPF